MATAGRCITQQDEWKDASGIEGTGTPRGKKEVTKEMTKARAINDQVSPKRWIIPIEK